MSISLLPVKPISMFVFSATTSDPLLVSVAVRDPGEVVNLKVDPPLISRIFPAESKEVTESRLVLTNEGFVMLLSVKMIR